MKTLRNLGLMLLVAFAASLIPAFTGSAHAEPRVSWSEQVVLLNTSVDSIELSTGDVLRASAWETPGNGARWYQIGFCATASCSFINSALVVDQNDGRVYAAGEEIVGVRFYLTYDDNGTLLGGRVTVDNSHFAFR